MIGEAWESIPVGQTDNKGSVGFLLYCCLFVEAKGKYNSLKTTCRDNKTLPIDGCKDWYPLSWELYPIKTQRFVLGWNLSSVLVVKGERKTTKYLKIGNQVWNEIEFGRVIICLKLISAFY